jgi:hypothetical protein
MGRWLVRVILRVTLGLDDSQNADKMTTSKPANTATQQGRTFIRQQPQSTPKQTSMKISAETMTRKQEALLKNRLKNLVK